MSCPSVSGMGHEDSEVVEFLYPSYVTCICFVFT